jgi:hypothetical protein
MAKVRRREISTVASVIWSVLMDGAYSVPSMNSQRFSYFTVTQRIGK